MGECVGVSAWANGTFATGLLDGASGALAWGDAEWLGPSTASACAAAGGAADPDANPPGSWLRTTFSLGDDDGAAAVSRATLFVAGAGLYACTLDGSPVDDHLFGPTTPFWSRLYYDSVDVTALLLAESGASNGDHVLACTTGDGWYGHESNSIGAKICESGAKKCVPGIRALLRAHTADGAVVEVASTPATWRSYRSPVLASPLFGGESFNLSLVGEGAPFARADGGLADGALCNASGNASGVWSAPFASTPIVSSFELPPVRAVASFAVADAWAAPSAASVVGVGTGRADLRAAAAPPAPSAGGAEGGEEDGGDDAPSWVFDMGQNMAGFVSVTFPRAWCAGGLTMTLVHAEALHSDRGALFHHITEVGEHACRSWFSV